MAKNTGIEWCDHTWNPWFGCTEVSPACDFCYARVLMQERFHRVTWGAGEDRKLTAEGNWNEPLCWERAAAAAGKIETVFCLSLGDIWDNEVDPLWRHQAFTVMERTPHLLYLLLSKRIGNAVKMCDPMAGNPRLPRNAAIGATMVDQAEWDRDIEKLREAGRILGARFTFASVEPMLGQIDARGVLPDWVICGGESGTRARPMNLTWARSLRDQCWEARVPFFFKQHGEWLCGTQYTAECLAADDNPEASLFPCMDWDGEKFVESGGMWCDDLGEDAVFRVGRNRAGRLLDGIEYNGMPEVAPA